MLKRLHWQLSLLYILVAAGLITLISVGAYRLLAYYFQESTDLALQYKVALEFTRSGLPVPADLADAGQTWQARRAAPTATPVVVLGEHEDEEENGTPPTGSSNSSRVEGDEVYDSELAPVFVQSIDAQGNLLVASNTFAAPLQPDQQAVQAALASGQDFRTIQAADGSRYRLFSYRVQGQNGSFVWQVGRSLKDQDNLSRQMLLGLLALGSIAILVMGAASWWLAGRSLIPAEQAWDRQQTFVANASHELRTPLTLMRASAEVASRHTELTDDRHILLDDILSEIDQMGRLVDDLLLLSRWMQASLSWRANRSMWVSWCKVWAGKWAGWLQRAR